MKEIKHFWITLSILKNWYVNFIISPFSHWKENVSLFFLLHQTNGVTFISLEPELRLYIINTQCTPIKKKCVSKHLRTNQLGNVLSIFKNDASLDWHQCLSIAYGTRNKNKSCQQLVYSHEPSLLLLKHRQESPPGEMHWFPLPQTQSWALDFCLQKRGRARPRLAPDTGSPCSWVGVPVSVLPPVPEMLLPEWLRDIPAALSSRGQSRGSQAAMI